MKLIIAGSRTIYLFEDEVCAILNSKSIPEVTEVVCGMAYGMDQSGLDWADNYKIPVKPFPADWERYGRSAGHIRNKEMADYADALLIVWDGSSKGSKNMKQNMLKLNKPIYEVILKGKNV